MQRLKVQKRRNPPCIEEGENIEFDFTKAAANQALFDIRKIMKLQIT